tara:strand:- start:1060 stop:2139 length:1080 start_codon:yes stop_codon:yes gene_type:complete
MEQAYQYFLSLEFRHNYFKDGLFRSLQVSFDEVTMQLTKNLGIIIKSYPGGVHFFSSNLELLKDISLSTPLRLFLTSNDPNYINYTVLKGYTPLSSILYFNNLQPTKEAIIEANLPSEEKDSLTKYNLHSKDFISKNEIVLLNFGSLDISKLEIPDYAIGKQYDFKDVFGNNLKDHILKTNEETDQFYISNLHQGIIRIFSNEQEVAKVYYNPQSVWKKPLGIIELYLSKINDHQQPENKLIYRLKFDVQKTKWKYFLVDSVYEKYKGLMIVDSSDKQHFTPSKEEKFQGKNVRVIESTKEIGLAEYSNSIFQLKNKILPENRDKKPIIVIGALPIATAEQIHFKDKNNKETKYSHIYL